MLFNYRIFVYMFGAIVGCGALALPYYLYPFGWYSLYYLIITAIIFSSFIYVFWKSGNQYLENSNKYAPVLTKTVMWFYWIGSWLSTVVIVNEIISNSTLLGLSNHFIVIALCKIVLIGGFTYVNTYDNQYSTQVETFVSVLKLLILLILPCAFLFLPNKSNLYSCYNTTSMIKCVNLCSFSYLGIEIGAIIDEHKSPSSLFTMLITMIIIVCVYIFNCYSIFRSGYNPSLNIYGFLAQKLIPYSWISNIIIGAIILIGLGSLNSWIYASAVVACESSQAGLLPKWMGKQENGIAKNALYISSGCLLVACLFLSNSILLQFAIEASVLSFFCFYSVVIYGCARKYQSYILYAVYVLSIAVCCGGFYTTINTLMLCIT